MQHASPFTELCNEIKPHIQEITKAQAVQLIESDPDTLLIDVRDHHEFEQGALPGAFHVSKGWIEAKIHQVAKSQDQNIILYCGGGNRSAIAAFNLQKMGYSKVYSLIGGYKGWQSLGH